MRGDLDHREAAALTACTSPGAGKTHGPIFVTRHEIH